MLSPSTEASDRSNKFSAYRQLESLQTYWLIDSFTRMTGDDWLLLSYNQSDEMVKIAALDVEFLLKELYEYALVA